MLIAEAYHAGFSKQATRFYMGEEALVPKVLAENPNALDYVPNNALLIEHFVAALRQAERRSNKGSSIRTQSNQLIVGYGAYLRQLERNQISSEESEPLYKWVKYDPNAKLCLAMERQQHALVNEEKKKTLFKSKHFSE